MQSRRRRMPHSAALPFVIHREHGVVAGTEVTSTRDHLYGLLRLDGDRVVIQWRTSREVSRVGKEIRTDIELAPVREVELPLAALAGARTKRIWRNWWLRDALVLNASDLRAFDELTSDQYSPGLVLEHPAEVVLETRKSDRPLVREFIGELRLAISEHLLASIVVDSGRIEFDPNADARTFLSESESDTRARSRE